MTTEDYLARRGPAARRRRAAARQRARQLLTPEERLLWAIFGRPSKELQAELDAGARGAAPGPEPKDGGTRG